MSRITRGYSSRTRPEMFSRYPCKRGDFFIPRLTQEALIERMPEECLYLDLGHWQLQPARVPWIRSDLRLQTVSPWLRYSELEKLASPQPKDPFPRNLVNHLNLSGVYGV